MKLVSCILAVLFLLPVAAKAAFDDVSLNSGTTISTTVGGETINLTVVAGKVEKLDVTSDNLAISMAAGSVVDLTSAGRKTFTYNKTNVSASFECGSSSSKLTLSLGGGLATEVVSVSPLVAVCSAVGSVSGGSTTTTTTTTSSTPSTTTTTSTTSSTPSTTTTTAAATPSTTTTTASTPPVTTPAPAPVPVPVPTPAPVVSAAPVLMSQLKPGARSDEVMKLQELLAEDPEIYPEGIVSGFYGPKTTAAVKRFQAKYGLPQVGRVGPATLAKINEVLGESAMAAQTSAPVATSVQAQTANQIQSQIQAIQQQIQSLTSGAASTPVSAPVSGEFVSALRLGSRNAEVKLLQQVLNSDPDTMIASSGVGSAGRETTYFGPATRAAVQKFQVKYGIAGSGEPGYGYVGPATRAKLNEVSGGESSSMPEGPSSAAPKAPVTASAVDVMTKQIEDQIKTIQAQIDALLKR